MTDEDKRKRLRYLELKAKEEEGSSSEPSILEAVGQGLMRESVPVVGSYADLIRAKINSLLGDKTPIAELEKQYRASGKAAKEAHPAAYHGAGLAGGLAAAYALPELEILKRLGFFGRLAGAGTIAAAEGGAARPEGAESMTPEQELKARAQNAELGALFGAGGEATVGSLLRRYLGEGAKERAKDAAYDVLGATKKTTEHIARDEKKAIGKTLLESGIVGALELPPSRSTVQNRIQKEISNSEDALADLLFQNKEKLGPTGSDLAASTEAIMRRNASIPPGNLSPQAKGLLTQMLSLGESKQGFLSNTTPKELNLLRKNAQKNVDWERRQSKKFMRNEEDKLKENFYVAQQAAARNALENVSPEIGDELSKQHRLIPANEMLSSYMNPADMAQWANRNKLLIGSGLLGLTGLGARLLPSGGGELGSSAEQLGALGLAAGLYSKHYGPQTRALLYNQLLKRVPAPSSLGVGNLMSGWAPQMEQQ